MKTIVNITTPKFPLGEVVATSNAVSQLDPSAIAAAIIRHAAGDWGEVCREDAKSNEDALKFGDRLLSVYRDGSKKFWIITEADRSVTTVLMPEDY